MTELIRKTQFFREVVITCRTQFFSTAEEEPKETGIMYHGGEGGIREFRKLYISPFSDKDIETYLNKRFAWRQRKKKRKARQIVDQCPNLMIRPMLLSHIEELLQRDSQYTAPFMVYAELIQSWVEREAEKFRDPQKRQHYQENLFHFSREVAIHIFRHREERGGLYIPGPDIERFAQSHQIYDLEEIEMKSKSLLNRNVQGQYKFSHKSILEYFLAEEAFLNADFRRGLDFEGMDQVRSFLEEMIHEKYTVPFFAQAEGRYCISNGAYLDFTKLNGQKLLELLPRITGLKLFTWDASNDPLLFKGLAVLKELEFIGNILDEKQLEAIKQELPDCKVSVNFVALRSQQKTVSDSECQEIFGLGKNNRPLQYIQNEYDVRPNVVFDRVTGLTWERYGSKKELTYKQVQDYVNGLNAKKFAGYDNLRLPTIPELMSLLESEKQSNGLYINPIFPKPKDYAWYWSADTGSPESAWYVGFDGGKAYWDFFGSTHYVRCVRS